MSRMIKVFKTIDTEIDSKSREKLTKATDFVTDNSKSIDNVEQLIRLSLNIPEEMLSDNQIWPVLENIHLTATQRQAAYAYIKSRVKRINASISADYAKAQEMIMNKFKELVCADTVTDFSAYNADALYEFFYDEAVAMCKKENSSGLQAIALQFKDYDAFFNGYIESAIV